MSERQRMEKPKPDNKRDAILRAAYDVFASYGFRRTSMDDIAKAAGVSRPALYQSFANKQEIFRGIVEAHIVHVETELSWLIGQDKPLAALLREMLETAILDPHRMLEAMPHGQELLGMKTEAAADLFRIWEDKCQNLYEQALAKHTDADRAKTLARVISLAVSGMKSRGMGVEEMEREIEAVVGMAGLAGVDT